MEFTRKKVRRHEIAMCPDLEPVMSCLMVLLPFDLVALDPVTAHSGNLSVNGCHRNSIANP